MGAFGVQQELAISFPMKGVWTPPVLKGRTMPFYALLRMSTGLQAVPEWETYADSCVRKGTAKLIQIELISLLGKAYKQEAGADTKK